MLLTLALSLTFPAADSPETPYNESEAQPYEATPQVSAAGPRPDCQIEAKRYGGEVEISAPLLLEADPVSEQLNPSVQVLPMRC
jgi:hypothetical protein